MTPTAILAFLRAEAARYDAEAAAHRATHGRRESESVRAKKRGQARALRRAADAIEAAIAAEVVGRVPDAATFAELVEEGQRASKALQRDSAGMRAITAEDLGRRSR